MARHFRADPSAAQFVIAPRSVAKRVLLRPRGRTLRLLPSRSEKESSMDCPACKQPLREKSVGEFTVDVCYGGCGGIWFDANELERVSVRAAGSLHRVWQ